MDKQREAFESWTLVNQNRIVRMRYSHDVAQDAWHAAWALATAAERERCAKVCEVQFAAHDSLHLISKGFADAIRGT